MGKSIRKILLLGSGELGKELVISLKRLGLTVVAVDRYTNAPAMQVADSFEVINMLNAGELERIVKKHKPDLIVPEIEAIRTEKLLELEEQGFKVIPTATAAHLTMNRDAIRDLASKKLGLKTARYAYAGNLDELTIASQKIGFPLVVKPVMSSSGKGQSIAKSARDLKRSWDYAQSGRRGDQVRVIAEEFIRFESEITLLTVKQKNAKTIFVKPIGHRQERGDYQESWMPAQISAAKLAQAQRMAKKITDYLGGAGLFGVEFFVTARDVIFSELSPRPHDTGMVTLISQDLSEFDLHARAILGLPIPDIQYFGPAASAVILAKSEGPVRDTLGLNEALSTKKVEVRIFGKKDARKNRRMGVALATAESVASARSTALKAASQIKLKIGKA